MGYDKIFPVFIKVLTNKYVIMVFIAVVLFLSFVAFVANYVKKPKPPKMKRRIAPAPVAESSGDEDGGDDSEDGGDDGE